MGRPFTEGEKFEKLPHGMNSLSPGVYEDCTFISCDFSESDFSGINFSECEFDGCNLSLVRLAQTTFRAVIFKNCKLLGLHFEDCNNLLMDFKFENCNLSLCTFYKLKLKNTLFKNSQITEADFSEADMGGAYFENCNLERSTFKNTILEKADFRTAYNYSIDPGANRIRGAKFSLAGIEGLLDKYDIEIEK